MLESFFSVGNMLKPSQRVGHIPSSKTVYQNFFQIAWPSAVESTLVGLVGAIDTMMVGGIGTDAIAAVGITNQPKFILLAAISSLNVGVTAIVSRRKGEGNQEGANSCLKQCMLISAFISFIMAIAGYCFAEEILIFAGATEDYLGYAVDYFRIIMVSIFFQAINLTVNAAQRGVGNTKISMRTNVTGNIVNVICNFLLINGIAFFPRLGVKGAAIATTIGAFVACCMSISTLFKSEGFLGFSHPGKWRPEKPLLLLLVSISGSAFVEQVFMRIGFFTYAKIVAALGTTAYATHLICMNILSLSFNFADGFGVAASSLVGQSLGAKRSDMAILYVKTGQRIVFCVSAVLCVFFIIGRRFLMSLFTTELEVIELGAIIVLFIACITYLQTSQVVITGCLRGAGDTRFVAVSSLISVTFVRPILAWLFCYPLGFGLIGAWFSLFADQGLRLALNFWRFSTGKWTTIKI